MAIAAATLPAPVASSAAKTCGTDVAPKRSATASPCPAARRSSRRRRAWRGTRPRSRCPAPRRPRAGLTSTAGPVELRRARAVLAEEAADGGRTAGRRSRLRRRRPCARAPARTSAADRPGGGASDDEGFDVLSHLCLPDPTMLSLDKVAPPTPGRARPPVVLPRRVKSGQGPDCSGPQFWTNSTIGGGAGIEPSADRKAHNGFRDRPVQPLRDPSEARGAGPHLWGRIGSARRASDGGSVHEGRASNLSRVCKRKAARRNSQPRVRSSSVARPAPPRHWNCWEAVKPYWREPADDVRPTHPGLT